MYHSILFFSGPLKQALKNIKSNLHDDKECKWHCELNEKYFKQDLLPCKFLLDQPKEPSELIDWREDPQPTESALLVSNETESEMDDLIENLPWWKKHPNYCGWLSFSLYFMVCTLIALIVASQYNYWDCPFGYNLDENNTCNEGMVFQLHSI